MRGDVRKSTRRFCTRAALALVGIALLSPGSVSVLCIAPGGHVAMEELNAACCAQAAISVSGWSQPGNGFTSSGGCRNCTDVFLAEITRGAVPESQRTAAPDSAADSCLEHQLASDTLFPSSRPAMAAGIEASFAAVLSVPLRC